jgi:hypothetical protein
MLWGRRICVEKIILVHKVLVQLPDGRILSLLKHAIKLTSA